MNNPQRGLAQILLFLLLAVTSTADTSPGAFAGWLNQSALWTSPVISPGAQYADGRVVPLRYVGSFPSGTTHTIRLKYTFSSGSNGRFIDYLQSFDATESGVSLLGGLNMPTAQLAPATWPIPSDTSLSPPSSGFVQPNGVLTTYNIRTLRWGTAYRLSSGVKEILVTFTVAGSRGGANQTVVIGFGGHLATESVWGAGGGASQFAGTSRRATASVDNGSDLNVLFQPDILPTYADLEVTQVGPAKACAGSEVTYQVTLRNLGPGVASSVVVSNVLPAGGTLVSTTTTAGSASGAGPVKLTLPSLASGASVGLSVVVKLGATGVASAANTASVSASTIDPVGVNNSSSVSTSTLDQEPPQISVPAEYVLDVATGDCAIAADFSTAAITAIDDCDGNVGFTISPPAGTVLEPGTHEFTVSAKDAAGNEASKKFQVLVRDNPNVAWPAAIPLTLVTGQPGFLEASFSQCINFLDQSRWYRFRVTPGSRVFVTLTGLPQNYDLVCFKDIAQAYQELLGDSGDLPLLGAQFAADAFSPAKFSADAFSPAVFSAAAFSPVAFSPAKFSPAVFSPAVFSPAVFSPAVFSPDIYAPDAFSPAIFSPAVFSPAAFSPAVFSPAKFSPAKFSPAVFSPAAFSEAQLRSVIAVSGFDGTASEGLVANTWNNDGEFYVRVRGRNGVFQPGAPFQLNVYVQTGACEDVVNEPPVGTPTGPAAVAGGYRTLIVTDSSRMAEAGAGGAVGQKLAELAARSEVSGRIVDLAEYPAIAWFNAQADTHFDCPYAKNLVSDAIRTVLGQWRSANPVENIVLVGGDSIVPFFRYPDQALLGPESNYIPPVKDLTPSQASLRLNYVFGQDLYGASCEVELKLATIPLPEVPVGRLVESPNEIIGMVQAYLDVPGGVLPSPTTALVTGYDFLSDAASGVEAEFEAGMGVQIDTLIDASTVPPANGWTANQLRSALFGGRHDLIYLAGHFSAFSALAADYSTVVEAAELEQSSTDFKNSILISAGCHSGYNTLDGDGIPFVTPQPDWAQAAARRQATLVAGTGYQYGDTDFIEYSERLYLRLARELRTGSGPVSIGQALVRAKREYLATTPVMRGIHEKAFLEATLFGSVVSSAPTVNSDPGLTLGLGTAGLTVLPTFTERTVALQDVERGGSVLATYLEGSNGTLVNPAEPVLPLEVRNVTLGGTTLRGVGWLGGDYVDQTGITPLTGAAATEIRGVHASFVTDVLFPIRFWSVNYYDALCGSVTDATRLYVWPAQFVSDNSVDAVGTLRRHTKVDFKLFYSANRQAYDLEDGSGQVVPAISAPPAISGVFSTIDNNRVKFQANVTGNPIAGIQEVWITYTAVRGVPYGKWRSFNLTQNPSDSTLWQGELDFAGLGIGAGDIRYVVQAVNGVGLVSMHTRKGSFHVPGENEGWETVDATSTSVALLTPPTEARYGEKLVLRAAWSNGGGEPVGGRSLLFTVGDQQVFARTDSTGVATATLNILSVPGEYAVKVSFQGGFGFAPADDEAPITIKPAATQIRFDPDRSAGQMGPGPIENVLLSDENGPLIERSVLLVITGPANVVRTMITDLNGRAGLPKLPSGNYSITAYFGQRVVLPGGTDVVDLRDSRYLGSQASSHFLIDIDPPTLISLTVDKPVLQPVDNTLKAVRVRPSFTDSGGTPVSRILKVTSNEPASGPGYGDLYPDVQITGALTVRLRAESSPLGSGRVYTIYVETKDPFGNSRTDMVEVRVPGS